MDVLSAGGLDLRMPPCIYCALWGNNSTQTSVGWMWLYIRSYEVFWCRCLDEKVGIMGKLLWRGELILRDSFIVARKCYILRVLCFRAI